MFSDSRCTECPLLSHFIFLFYLCHLISSLLLSWHMLHGLLPVSLFSAKEPSANLIFQHLSNGQTESRLSNESEIYSCCLGSSVFFFYYLFIPSLISHFCPIGPCQYVVLCQNSAHPSHPCVCYLRPYTSYMGVSG